MQSLIDRFKQFRRTKKDRLGSTPKANAIVTKPNVRSPSAILQIPTTPAGEDKLSFERHNKAILSEMKKARGGNATVINELVNRTYPMRRQEILLNSYDISVFFTKYPFLKDNNQVNNLP